MAGGRAYRWQCFGGEIQNGNKERMEEIGLNEEKAEEHKEKDTTYKCRGVESDNS